MIRAEDCPVKGAQEGAVRLVDHGVSTDEVVEGTVVVAKVKVVVSMVGCVVDMGDGIVLVVEVPIEET